MGTLLKTSVLLLALLANQGFPNEGKDHRVFGFLAPVARALTFHSDRQPLSLVVQAPFGFRFYTPLPGAKRMLMIRAGWHFDPNAKPKSYIPGLAAKMVDNPSLY